MMMHSIRNSTTSKERESKHCGYVVGIGAPRGGTKSPTRFVVSTIATLSKDSIAATLLSVFESAVT